jgi:cardiolipin synthase
MSLAPMAIAQRTMPAMKYQVSGSIDSFRYERLTFDRSVLVTTYLPAYRANDFMQTRHSSPRGHPDGPSSRQSARALAERSFSRASGAPLVEGNRVRLLINAAQNYPAWLAAIASARHHVHFESYIIHEDIAGVKFANALIAKAQDGVHVRLIYDWMGGLGKASRQFWKRLRSAGVEVRCYNPPHFDSPLGWLSRDHRKMLAVDGEVGFISGLCVGRMWVGEPEKNIDPWRDTGVEVRGPAIADIERAFAEVWALMGDPIPNVEVIEMMASPLEGDVSLRIVATVPATGGLFRLDELVAAMARGKLWLTDAYFAGTTSYVQALRAAARDGVDVRLLVPNATDIPLLRPLSRSGYRPLLQAGVRIFEWNGTMIHAKTAVADGRWARVGSTNLNVASWLGNCELDAVIENGEFALQMEAQYLTDLSNATEVILNAQKGVSAPGEPRHQVPGATSGGGSSGRAAAGAIRIGNAVGAAFTDRRVLEPLEARLVLVAGLLLLGIAVLLYFVPEVAGHFLMAIAGWVGLAFVYRAYKLHRKRDSR